MVFQDSRKAVRWRCGPGLCWWRGHSSRPKAVGQYYWGDDGGCLQEGYRTASTGTGRGRAWWRHQMISVSSLLAICAGNSPVTGEFPAQRPVTRSFDVFFDLRLNKRLSKQSWGWWFKTLSRPLWRHCNALKTARLRHTNFFVSVGLGDCHYNQY